MKVVRLTQSDSTDHRGIECKPIPTVTRTSFDTDQRDYQKLDTSDWSVEFRAFQLCKRLNGCLIKANKIYDPSARREALEKAVTKALRDNRKFIKDFEHISREYAGLCTTCAGASNIKGGRIYQRSDVQAQVNLSDMTKADWASFAKAISETFESTDVEYSKRTIIRKHRATSYRYNTTFKNALVRPLIRIILDGNRFVFSAFRITSDGQPIPTLHSEAYYTDFLCVCN